jgi:hypothetical protein
MSIIEDDLETLKSRLWKQFNRACDLAENSANVAADNAANRNAAAAIGLAIVAVEKEERERTDSAKPSRLDKPALHAGHLN